MPVASCLLVLTCTTAGKIDNKYQVDNDSICLTYKFLGNDNIVSIHQFASLTAKMEPK